MKFGIFYEHQLPRPWSEGANRGIGTPAEMREHLRGFAEAGVDQVVFIQQSGKNRHEHICESLELLASEVMPEFKAGEEDRERRHQPWWMRGSVK
jgi:alkanesulfonate monooxygenase SsuD/methylene tetrahydromethanopterin reductase-like flavin-dependent oxidoreductase (luciferase family)